MRAVGRREPLGCGRPYWLALGLAVVWERRAAYSVTREDESDLHSRSERREESSKSNG